MLPRGGFLAPSWDNAPGERRLDVRHAHNRHPRVRDRREAVRRTMALIARTLAEEPKGIHLSLEDYGNFVA
jgi:hypothetical protein